MKKSSMTIWICLVAVWNGCAIVIEKYRLWFAVAALLCSIVALILSLRRKGE